MTMKLESEVVTALITLDEFMKNYPESIGWVKPWAEALRWVMDERPWIFDVQLIKRGR